MRARLMLTYSRQEGVGDRGQVVIITLALVISVLAG